MLARSGVCIICCCWQKSRNFENFEDTIFLEKKDPLHPLPSVHVARERGETWTGGEGERVDGLRGR